MVHKSTNDSTLFSESGMKLWISGFFGFSGRVESDSGFFGFGLGSGRVEIFNPIENSNLYSFRPIMDYRPLTSPSA